MALAQTLLYFIPLGTIWWVLILSGLTLTIMWSRKGRRLRNAGWYTAAISGGVSLSLVIPFANVFVGGPVLIIAYLVLKAYGLA